MRGANACRLNLSQHASDYVCAMRDNRARCERLRRLETGDSSPTGAKRRLRATGQTRRLGLFVASTVVLTGCSRDFSACPPGFFSTGDGCELRGSFGVDRAFGIEGRAELPQTNRVGPNGGLTAVSPTGTLLHAFQSGSAVGLSWFDDDGRLLRRDTLDLGTASDVNSVLATQADNGVWLCGTSQNRGYLLALDWSGAPIETIGASGLVLSANEEPRVCNGVIDLEDGPVIMAGQGRSSEGNGDDIVVSAFSQDGAPWPGFGEDGVARIERVGDQFGAFARPLANRGAVLSGSNNSDGNLDAALLVIDENGQPDSEFAESGWLQLDFAGEDDFLRVALPMPDGSLMLIGSRTISGVLHGFVARFFSNGVQDRSFGDDGFFQLESESSFEAGALDNAGRVFVAGRSVRDGAADGVVLRLSPNGDLQETELLRLDFGGDEEVDSLVFDRDDRLVASGTYSEPTGEICTFIVRFVELRP